NGAIATGTTVTETSLSGVNYTGSATPGSDTLWLQTFDGQWSNWVAATLTDPGATPDTITSTPQSVPYNQSVAVSSLFNVTGPTPSLYHIYLNAPSDGSVTDSHGTIAAGTSVTETSLSGVNFIGSGVPGSDTLWLQTFDGQWSNWVSVA